MTDLDHSTPTSQNKPLKNTRSILFDARDPPDAWGEGRELIQDTSPKTPTLQTPVKPRTRLDYRNRENKETLADWKKKGLKLSPQGGVTIKGKRYTPDQVADVAADFRRHPHQRYDKGLYKEFMQNAKSQYGFTPEDSSIKSKRKQSGNGMKKRSTRTTPYTILRWESC